MLCVHKKCSGITKWLVKDPNYICPRCKGKSRLINGRTVTEVDVDGTMLDVEATVCYLGDMLCSGDGCDSATAARCCVAWGKFRKLLTVLTTTHLSLRICGKVYEACVCSAMLHGRETWRPKEFELQWLCRNDCAMICWICGIKNRDQTPSSLLLLLKLGIKDITWALVLHCWWLRQYGHIQRATSCIKSITNFYFPALERKEGLVRHGLNVWRLMLISVA